MKEKKHRYEDALNATRAAVEEGIIAGGGTTFLAIAPLLDEIEAEGDEKIGVNIVKRALEEPIRQIASNAGYEGSVVVEKVKALHQEGKTTWGFDAVTETYRDMIEAGIIDPVKVARCALENAASIAGLLLTTETLVTEIPEKEKEKVPGGGYSDYEM